MHPRETLSKWHEVVRTNNIHLLDDLLADNVVFYSPVVWTPQEGKFLTKLYLISASQVIGGQHFKYTQEIVSDKAAMLEFTTVVDDITINGVDIIEFNEQGKIKSFKVMVRPLKAINKLHQKMGEIMNLLTK